MLYCTYEQYQTAGGTLDEAAFDTLCARASRLIGRHTFGRAEPHARACAVPGASSVSNDGYSVTFASGALSERLAAEAQSILSNALGSDPHGLLYRGCF